MQKRKSQLTLIHEIFYFAYKIQQNVSTVFRMVLKRLRLHQFLNGVVQTFSYRQAWVLEVGQ